MIDGWMLCLIGKGMKRSISMALTLVKNIKYCMAKVTRVPNVIDDDDIGVNEVRCKALHVIGEDSVDEEERKKESICDVWLCLKFISSQGLSLMFRYDPTLTSQLLMYRSIV